MRPRVPQLNRLLFQIFRNFSQIAPNRPDCTVIFSLKQGQRPNNNADTEDKEP